MGASSSAQTVGYRYYLGMQMGLCRGPIDEILEIKCGDLQAFPWASGSWILAGVIWQPGSPDNPYSPPITASGSYMIEALEIFGGDKKEGGVYGNLIVMMGEETQIYPDWIKAKLGGLVPDFRGVVTLYFDGLITSLNPYPKKWKIRHRRTMNGWDGPVWQPDLCTIWLGGGKIKAMNPAHILYECATNRDWGRGLPRTRLRESSWLAAAQTLFNEGFGLCMRWSRRETLDTFVQNVLDHIGGGIHVDRETGLLDLRLIRGDYDPNAIPLFDYNSGLLAVDTGEVAARDNAVNEIAVTYHDPVSDEDRSVRAQSLGSIQSLGVVNNSTISYPGLPTFDLAARVAQRDLRASTTASRRYKVTLDRRGWRIFPGAVFRISAPDKGVSNLVLRAGKVSEGSVTDGKIVVDALIDVFGLPAAAFVKPQEPGWTPPDNTPPLLTNRLAREATYRDMYLRLSSVELAALDPASGAIATMAVKPSSQSLGYAIATRIGSNGYVTRNSDVFSPAVRLSSAVAPYATVLSFNQGYDLGLVQIDGLVQIEDEIVQLTDIDADAGTITVLRGCLDTVPKAHSSGTLAFFFDDPVGTDGVEYASGETVDVKMLTTTSTGTLSESIAPEDSVDIVARQARPYPPGNVRVNGTLCQNVATVAGAMLVTWAHRNRVTQADQIVPHTASSVSPETGTEYRLRIYNASNVLLHTASGLTSDSYTVPTSYTGNLRFVLDCSRDGLTSFQAHSFTMTRS